LRDFDIIHKVKEGETLASIAAYYNIPVNMIIRENRLSGDIYPGQRLVIGFTKGEIYTVKPNDTIEDIALKFGMDAQTILQDNNIEMIYPFLNIVINRRV
jgi:LysM repeat protein